MRRGGRAYWEEQLSEYWESGLTIQEYGELKDLPYESLRRWIRLLKDGDPKAESSPVELVEVVSSTPGDSGVGLKVGEIEILLEKGFDSLTLREVLTLLRESPCSAPAER